MGNDFQPHALRMKSRDLRSFEIRFEFESIRKWRADSIKSATPAVVPQTTLTVQQKNSTVVPL